MKTFKFLALVLVAMLGLALSTQARPKDPTQFDCRVTKITRVASHSKVPDLKRVKVCPHKQKLAAGQCEFVRGKGMRCRA
jgi:hypothetical protein